MKIDDESWHQRLRKEKADVCSLHCSGLLETGDTIVLSVLFSLVQSVSVVAIAHVWTSVSTGTGSTKHTGLLLFTSSIPLKSDSLGGSWILDSFVSTSCLIWDIGSVMLACEVAVSPSWRLVKDLEGCSEREELEEAGRPEGSHLGCMTEPSKASNCLRS